MAKKRGSIWDGIRDVYHLHQASEALGALHRSSGQVLEKFSRAWSNPSKMMAPMPPRGEDGG